MTAGIIDTPNTESVRDVRPLAGQDSLEPRVLEVLTGFTAWLESFGETSWDHQSFFAGAVGSRAKALYYRNKALGTACRRADGVWVQAVGAPSLSSLE